MFMECEKNVLFVASLCLFKCCSTFFFSKAADDFYISCNIQFGCAGLSPPFIPSNMATCN